MTSVKGKLLAALLLLGVVAATAGDSSRLLLRARAPAIPLVPTNLYNLTASEVVPLLCNRTITAVEYVQALFDYYDQGGFTCLNNFISYNQTKVLADAAAIDAKAAAGQDITPLCGMPLAVKDSISVLGYRATGATPALANAYPLFTAPLVDQYLAANGIILGKMNLAELSSSSTSINPNVPGNNITTPLNPYNQTKIVGGSSGGSAASVAARIAPWSLCEDTGGSCRSPALANGIFGFRPTLGCYNSSDSLIPGAFTRDTVGSMGRTMGDLILLDSIIRNSNFTTTAEESIPNDPVPCAVNVNRNLSLNGLRMGLPSNFGWVNPGLQGEQATMANATLAKLQAAGVVLVPFDSSNLDNVSNTAWGHSIPEVFTFEEQDALAIYLERNHYNNITVYDVWSQINSPDLRQRLLSVLNVTNNELAGNFDAWIEYLQTGRPALAQAWKDAFTDNQVDVLLYTGYSVPIPSIDAASPNVQFPNGSISDLGTEAFFGIDSKATATALAFPIGLDSTGTPTGLMIAGKPGDDSLVLSVSLALEKLIGPMPQPPTMAGCMGCTANVTYIPTTYNSSLGLTGPLPTANETWTNFQLTFDGTCMTPLLNSYGKGGPLGEGMKQAILLNAAMNATSTSVAPAN